MIANTANDRIQLVNARIADVDNGCYYDPEVSLIVEKGRIAAMPGLPGEPQGYPADAVIDLHGIAVVPGLFNTHCHLQFGDLGEPREGQIERNLAACVDRGVTTVRDTLCYDLTQNQSLVDRISRGELAGPRILQSVHVGPLGHTYAPKQGIMIRMMFPVMKMPVIDYRDRRSGVVAFRPDASDQEVRDAIDRAIDERGAAAIKFCDQPEHFLNYKPGANVITARQLQTAVDEAHRRGAPTTIHNVTIAGFRNALKAGVRSLAHLPIDGELTDEDADVLLRSKTSIEPTLTVSYYMSYNMKGSPYNGHPEIRRLDAYRDATFDSYIGETWRSELQKNHRARHALLQSGEMKLYHFLDLSAPFRYMAPFVVTGGQNLRRLVAHGAASRLALGNDAGPGDCSPAVVDQELSMFGFFLNRNGERAFTAADALRIATIQSAYSLGLEENLGSIRTGKIADLAVLEGDPLGDFHVIGKPVQALFKDGKLVVDRCGLQLAHPAP
jgi:imidazolonepropionase-like amidohydrolase